MASECKTEERKFEEVPSAYKYAVWDHFGFSVEYDEQDSDLRMVLLGKTGSGKSSAGNTILGEKKFRASLSPESVTRNCTKHEATMLGRKISVIDTPGLFDTSLSEAEIKNCVQLALLGPHVFLLVIKLGRFTEEERNAVEWIQENFGEEASKHTIILFTHEDQLDMPLDQFIKLSQPLEHLVKSCEGGYHSFNNVNSGDRFQAQKLIEKINVFIIKYYTNEMFQKAQEELNQKEEQKREEEARTIREREEQIREDERRRIQRESEGRRDVNARRSGESSGTCCRNPSGTVIGLSIGMVLAIVLVVVAIAVAVVYKKPLLMKIGVPIGCLLFVVFLIWLCIYKRRRQPREGERQLLINES